MLPYNNILFKDVNENDRQRMMDCFKPEIRHFKTGSRIIDFSENSDKIGVMLNGSAVMERYDANGIRTIIETLGSQSIFGAFFTFGSPLRSNIEIVAETDCEIMFFRRSDITKRCHNACTCHSQVVENLLELMSKKAISLTERIEVLSQRTIEDKLISCLSIIQEKTPDGKSPKIPFTTTALSDYLCVNRSALQRVITKLKNEGILTISKRRFQLIKYGDIDD